MHLLSRVKQAYVHTHHGQHMHTRSEVVVSLLYCQVDRDQDECGILGAPTSVMRGGKVNHAHNTAPRNVMQLAFSYLV